LSRGRSSAFYLLTGNSNYSEREQKTGSYWDYNAQRMIFTSRTRRHSNFYWGFGCGFGFRVLGQFWTAFDLVMTSYEIERESYFYPLPQLSFYYNLWK